MTGDIYPNNSFFPGKSYDDGERRFDKTLRTGACHWWGDGLRQDTFPNCCDSLIVHII